MRPRSVLLANRVAKLWPADDAVALISTGRVRVDGLPVTNPRSMVRPGAVVTRAEASRLRGETKLAAALEQFAVQVPGLTALDVGASTGGFTRELLARGAARVFAVDVGHGQLLGSLRQDPRVVNLEGINVAHVSRQLIPNDIDLFTVDVSYLSLAEAARQLLTLRSSRASQLVGLVKPMFELRLGVAPTDPASLTAATVRAVEELRRSGWEVSGTMESPVRGARGAIEGFVHAVLPPA
ncbi:MAG TPA: SAM-dependent methyltransferase [Candidatus Dormibacteraeota bacterium]|jgi:23S rRNA (cytidine1920-2'-O)/16S rRNA (cytidine1409-2'-O)-methyltransferase